RDGTGLVGVYSQERNTAGSSVRRENHFESLNKSGTSFFYCRVWALFRTAVSITEVTCGSSCFRGGANTEAGWQFTHFPPQYIQRGLPRKAACSKEKGCDIRGGEKRTGRRDGDPVSGNEHSLRCRQEGNACLCP
ncbi:hypothetical protein, partial [Pseudomonas indica]|uniref:hypothetical protein n=1 Tax=Pseudomonas indica TaxID=137658 RepID=UPI0023F864A5